jgi:cbb3-type cytochrome oxidase maturation protein
MIIVVLLIAISLIIALVFLAIFFWNIRTGQYDDMFTPSVRMLFDEGERPDAEGTAREERKL